jgi:hypothetical protein
METFKVKRVRITVILVGFPNGQLQSIDNPAVQECVALYLTF